MLSAATLSSANMAMSLARWPMPGGVGALLAFSAMISAVVAGPSSAGPCAVGRGGSGGAVLRLSGGREYGDDDYDVGAAVSLAEVAQEAREKERETTTSSNAAAESVETLMVGKLALKAAAAAGSGGGGGGGGGRGGGAQLPADAFRKQHDISIRKLGSRAGCEQLEPVQSFGKVFPRLLYLH